MNKICTDIEQSKKLIELGIDANTADMYYPYFGDNKWGETARLGEAHEYSGKKDIPAWSLAALLNILPTLDERNPEFCKDISYNQWHVYYHGTATLDFIDTERYENLIDACYEMIIKLHEQELL